MLLRVMRPSLANEAHAETPRLSFAFGEHIIVAVEIHGRRRNTVLGPGVARLRLELCSDRQ